MSNEKEIVKSIENCLRLDNACRNCKYHCYTACKTMLLQDVLTLLEEKDKEIEELIVSRIPIEPIFNKTIKSYICGRCSHILDELRYDYCPECGLPVAWSHYEEEKNNRRI